MHNTSPAYDSRSTDTLRLVSELWKKSFARWCVEHENWLHCDTWGITCFDPVVCETCSSNHRRSHRGTNGMTGNRRAHDCSRLSHRNVLWSEKVFYWEQSKRKVQVEAKWHKGIFFGTKDSCSRAVSNRVQLDARAIPERDKLHRRQSENSCHEEFFSGDQWNWRYTGARTGVLGASMRDWDWSRRITTRNAVPGLSGTWLFMMTSIRERKLRKIELLKLHQRIEDEIVCKERDKRNSDSRNELKNKHIEIATPMQVNESDLDSSQRSRMEQIWNWRCWSWSLSLIFCSDDPTVVFRCKSSKTQMPTLT